MTLLAGEFVNGHTPLPNAQWDRQQVAHHLAQCRQPQGHTALMGARQSVHVSSTLTITTRAPTIMSFCVAWENPLYRNTNGPMMSQPHGGAERFV